MINEIIIQLSKENNHIWYLHLWEHCVIRNFELQLEKNKLNNQGIIVNGSTFLDSTTIEIFYSKTSLKSDILKAVNASLTDIPKDIIEHEISIITDEISYVDINEEEKVIYAGLKYTENDNILNLYKDLKLSVDEVLETFSTFVENIKIADFSDDKMKILQLTNTDMLGAEEDCFTKNQNSNFLTFDFKLMIKTIQDYLSIYFLAFMIGMTEDSVIHKNYLIKNKKYLGYSQFLMYSNNAHILVLLDVTNIGDIFVTDIIKDNILKDMTDFEFSKQLNAFKTYVGLYVSKYDFCKDILKFSTIQKEVSYNTLLSSIDYIKREDVQSHYERMIYAIKKE